MSRSRSRSRTEKTAPAPAPAKKGGSGNPEATAYRNDIQFFYFYLRFSGVFLWIRIQISRIRSGFFCLSGYGFRKKKSDPDTKHWNFAYHTYVGFSKIKGVTR